MPWELRMTLTISGFLIIAYIYMGIRLTNSFSTLLPWTVVSGNGIPDYEELYLMSRCRSHIIANSTFSWWGAWLSPYLSKIVIAPKKWFRNNQHIEYLIPRQWITI